MQKAHKEFHNDIGKYSKIVDKTFTIDPESAYMPEWNVDGKMLDTILAEHLYREGFASIAELIEKEAQIKIPDTYKLQFLELYAILDKLKKHDTRDALLYVKCNYNITRWCEKNRESLCKKNSNLEFQLHRLNFVQFIRSNSISMAIAYAKTNFATFSKNNMDDIRFLMGSILFATKLESSPYKSLLDDSHWLHIVQLFNM